MSYVTFVEILTGATGHDDLADIITNLRDDQLGKSHTHIRLVMSVALIRSGQLF